MVKTDNLPAELRETGLFCCWLYETRPGTDKPTKVPYNPRTGGKAQSTNRQTFAPLPTALEALERDGYEGIGVGVFDRLGAIDIDHCVSDAGELSEIAADILEIMQGYTEYSPSGKGLRILFTAPEGFQYDKARYYINNQKLGLEVYIAGSTNKYVTVTGDTLTPGAGLGERGEQLRAVLEKYMVRQRAEKPAAICPASAPIDLDDAALIEKIRQSRDRARFSSLWAGDITEYSGDDSRADMALCNILAWWTNRNAGRVDRLFRQSGLMREKWDRQQSGSTYGAITIQKAIDSTQSGYNPAEYQRQSSEAVTVSSEWEPPIPFESITLPDFPLEALPHPLDSFVECLAESTQTPEEMAGALSLGVLSTAFQAKYTATVTPDWKERLCLYTVPVALPGERKSAVLSALMAPCYEYEAMRREFEAEEIARNQTERAILEKMLQAAQSAVKGGKGDLAAKRHEALDLAAQLAKFKDKHPYRLIVDDTTPEKLIDLMEQQGGSITLSSAEGGVFDAMRGRYDQSANFDIYLKGHDGDPIKVDRIGRASNYIQDPRLTMLLTIQPEVLQGLIKDSTMRGRGFCGRFLYVMCRSRLGRRDVYPPPVPSPVKAEYWKFVRHILSSQGSGIIRLSPGADEVRGKYQAHIERKLGDEWEYMRDWGGKLVGATVRIAALFHAATVSNPVETPVSAEIMEAATKLGEFFSAHAEAAYQLMGADEGMDDAKYLLERIKRVGESQITKRTIFAKCQSRFKKVENMEPAVQILTERGYIRETEQKTNGRPSTVLTVNPIILSA